MKKYSLLRCTLSITIVLSLLIFSSACSNSKQVTILHTNDMHSQYLPVKATWVKEEPKPLIGGMVALKYFVDKERATSDNVLLLDAGDIMTGTPLSNIEVAGAKCGGFVKMMNLLGCNATTVGNHEFDNGVENLKRLFGLMYFDVLSANLFADDSLLAPKAYEIYQVGKAKVGVIGLILEDLFGVVPKKRTDGLKVGRVAKTAQTYIDKIDPETDLIVLLTHQGFEEDSVLAESIHGADVIVGGHSHTRLKNPHKINDILVVQAGSKTCYLGRLDLEVENDRVTQFQGRLIPLWVEEVKNPDLQMEHLVNIFQQQINHDYGAVIGTLKTPWKTSHWWESNLGDWLTDAMRDYAGTEFALLNSGGIRKRLQPGPITKLDIVEILPFSNYLVKFTCSGEQLLRFVQENAEASVQRTHGILQVSELSYVYRVDAGKKVTIISAHINGVKIHPKRTYTGVSVDYVLMGQEMKYLKFQPKSMDNLGVLVSDAVIEYLQAHPVVDSPLQGRIRRVRDD